MRLSSLLVKILHFHLHRSWVIYHVFGILRMHLWESDPVPVAGWAYSGHLGTFSKCTFLMLHRILDLFPIFPSHIFLFSVKDPSIHPFAQSKKNTSSFPLMLPLYPAINALVVPLTPSSQYSPSPIMSHPLELLASWSKPAAYHTRPSSVAS